MRHRRVVTKGRPRDISTGILTTQTSFQRSLSRRSAVPKKQSASQQQTSQLRHQKGLPYSDVVRWRKAKARKPCPPQVLIVLSSDRFICHLPSSTGCRDIAGLNNTYLSGSNSSIPRGDFRSRFLLSFPSRHPRHSTGHLLHCHELCQYLDCTISD